MDTSSIAWEVTKSLLLGGKKGGADSSEEPTTECKKYMANNLSEVTYSIAAWNTLACCTIIPTTVLGYMITVCVLITTRKFIM
jgi:hypothetical protein